MNFPPSQNVKKIIGVKTNVLVIVIAALLIAIIVSSPYTKMFGMFFDKTQNFTCCRNDQLIVHHFYTRRFFWIVYNKGYRTEPVGRRNPGGCNIECPADFR